MAEEQPYLSHLEKAKGALEEARELMNSGEGTNNRQVRDLLLIAEVQAAVSQAESLAGLWGFFVSRELARLQEGVTLPNSPQVSPAWPGPFAPYPGGVYPPYVTSGDFDGR